jgi:uncharacterized protein YndB with AHSA1/START domain
MVADAARSVSHQYLIRTPPSAVFAALTESGWLTRWLCDQAELSPRKGGTYRLSWKDGPTHSGTIREFLPGKRVALAWSWPGVDLAGTVLSFEVEAREGGTLLHVEHTGFPRLEQWTDLYGGAEWGWTYFAMNLKSVLEKGHDLRSKPDG